MFLRFIDNLLGCHVNELPDRWNSIFFCEVCVLFILLLDLIIFSRLLRLAFADSLSMVRPLFCNEQHLASVAQLCWWKLDDGR